MVVGMAELRESTYFVLAVLLDGPRHGYGIAQEAGELSGGRVKLSAGTLYGALERLVTQGLVQRDHDEVVDGRRRRFYRLTERGRTCVEVEAERLRTSALVVQARTAPRRGVTAPREAS
jgi:PadR family transcriptional regulator, regulatory protein PadR